MRHKLVTSKQNLEDVDYWQHLGRKIAKDREDNGLGLDDFTKAEGRKLISKYAITAEMEDHSAETAIKRQARIDRKKGRD
jgi:hypothetical protein